MIQKNRIPTAVQKLGKLFADEGHEIRIVGGWVRDTLRDVEPKDLDLATTATPEQIIDVCMKHNIRYIPTGIDHGTITILPTRKTRKSPDAKALADDWNKARTGAVPAYEVTTLRVDAETDGRHAKVEFTTDWQKDAERRDFTINAMSMDMDGKLYDYFNGEQHLATRQVIFVGDARARIQEDYLRILRWVRFRSRMGDMTYDRNVRNVIKETVSGLQQISVERIWMEMSKILGGSKEMLCICLIDMLETGILANTGLPDVERYDCVHATIVRDQTDNPLTVLAALTGKLIGPTWKMSRDEMDLLFFLQRHRRIPRPTLGFFKEVAVDHSLPYAIECASLFGPSDILAAIKAWTVPKFPVSGADLIAVGHVTGPQMGLTLNRLRQEWKDSDYQLTKDVLVGMF